MSLSSTGWRSCTCTVGCGSHCRARAELYTSHRSKKVFDTLVGVSESSTFSYDRLLELDSSYKRLLDELPPPWKGGGPDQRSAPHFVWKRNVMFEALHSRIVRLHRPFFTRGYTPGSRFAYSTQQCLISARQVIYTLRDLISMFQIHPAAPLNMSDSMSFSQASQTTL